MQVTAWGTDSGHGLRAPPALQAGSPQGQRRSLKPRAVKETGRKAFVKSHDLGGPGQLVSLGEAPVFSRRDEQPQF